MKLGPDKIDLISVKFSVLPNPRSLWLPTSKSCLLPFDSVSWVDRLLYTMTLSVNCSHQSPDVLWQTATTLSNHYVESSDVGRQRVGVWSPCLSNLLSHLMCVDRKCWWLMAPSYGSTLSTQRLFSDQFMYVFRMSLLSKNPAPLKNMESAALGERNLLLTHSQCVQNLYIASCILLYDTECQCDFNNKCALFFVIRCLFIYCKHVGLTPDCHWWMVNTIQYKCVLSLLFMNKTKSPW